MITVKYLVAAAIAGLLGSAVSAQDNGVTDLPDIDQIVQIDMMPGWPLADGAEMAALRVTLAPGWKTYWRVGGDTGIPPHFDWSGSDNIASVEYLWPRPSILTTDGVQVIGYKNELILPIRITPETPGKRMRVAASLELGVCKDVCVPVGAEIALAPDGGSDADRFLIALALADQPQSAKEAQLGRVACDLTPTQDGYQLNAEFAVQSQVSGTEVVVIEASNENIWVAPATSSRKGDTVQAQTSLLSFDGKAFSVEPDDLRVTIIWPDGAVDIQGCPPS